MGEFFKPWRRKIGVMTLVMAAVSAAGWVRSIYVEDRLAFPFRGLRHAISSFQGAVAWEHWLNDANQPQGIGWSSVWRSNVSLIHSVPFFQSPLGDDDDALGILQYESRSVPYWPFVIPMTLLSAYLLLWQRKTNSAAEKSATQ